MEACSRKMLHFCSPRLLSERRKSLEPTWLHPHLSLHGALSFSLSDSRWFWSRSVSSQSLLRCGQLDWPPRGACADRAPGTSVILGPRVLCLLKITLIEANMHRNMESIMARVGELARSARAIVKVGLCWLFPERRLGLSQVPPVTPTCSPSYPDSH